MSRIVTLVLSGALALATTAHAQTDPYQLIGFTDAKFTGGQGVLGFARACQEEFSFPARMCTSVEIMETVVLSTWVPADPFAFAWVRPVFAPTGTNPLDDSGVSTQPDDLSCSGWINNGNFVRGLVVNGSGAFTNLGCDSSLPVACCTPVPLNEPTP